MPKRLILGLKMKKNKFVGQRQVITSIIQQFLHSPGYNGNEVRKLVELAIMLTLVVCF